VQHSQWRNQENVSLLCRQERNIKSYVCSNFRFHKMLGTSWVDAQLVASQEGLRSMKLVNVVQGKPWSINFNWKTPRTKDSQLELAMQMIYKLRRFRLLYGSMEINVNEKWNERNEWSCVYTYYFITDSKFVFLLLQNNLPSEIIKKSFTFPTAHII
jgi:hypothetical protein